ncbi:MAG: FG-GAP repeat protein [Pseudomonadales bacterium]|nr:FG-GAP repeat protein [Pseudomonadales bacterium]
MNLKNIYGIAILFCVFISTVSFASPADVDEDGLPYFVESLVGLDDTNSADASADLDGDSWTNLEEFRFSTDLQSASSNPEGIEPARQEVFTSVVTTSVQRLGHSVAISGDTAVVATHTRAVYVYTKNLGVWSEEQELSVNPEVDDTFAYRNFYNDCLAVDGDTVVVCSKNAAYVFVRSEGVWNLQQQLLANDVCKGASYCSKTVAIWGDNIVVGEPFENWGPAGSAYSGRRGAAYLFVRTGSTWSLEQRITSSDGYRSDQFGSSVSIGDDIVAIGAFGDDPASAISTGNGTGAVYIFERDSSFWAQEQKIIAIDGDADDRFGLSVSLHENRLLVGAELDDDAGADAGAAYLFEHSNGSWIFEEKFIPSNYNSGSGFGIDVAINNNILVVGDPGGNAQDVTYIFEKPADTWETQFVLNIPDGGSGDDFGASVSVTDDAILVGAAFHDSGSHNQRGAAFFFDNADSIPSADNTVAVPIPLWFNLFLMFVIVKLYQKTLTKR